MEEKRRIYVTIDGEDFAVISSEEDEYIRDLANYVDKKIQIISSANKKLNKKMSATLAALHIGDELFKISEAYYKLETEARDPMEKYDSLNYELDEAKIEIKSYESLCSEYQENIVRCNSQKERILMEVEEQTSTIEEQKNVIEDLKNQIKNLRQDNYESQAELAETKKELADYLKLLDSKTRTD